MGTITAIAAALNDKGLMFVLVGVIFGISWWDIRSKIKRNTTAVCAIRRLLVGIAQEHIRNHPESEIVINQGYNDEES